MRRLLPAVLVGLLLAGCVSIPTSGPVQPGLGGSVSSEQEPLVRPIANPPRPDMTQIEVVAGFLDAVAAVGDDYRVAREYLTDEAAQSWDPGAGVTVMAADSPVLTVVGDTVTASYSQVATVNASGVYLPQPAAAATSGFAMASADGQWRIAQAPHGLLLSGTDLERAFEVRNAYFIDPGGSVAVPDVRLVPRTGVQALATALVAALLAGPSDWLAPAVASAIPAGMQLALGAVPVTDGVARVELQGPAIALEEQDLVRFGAQLAWTLVQVPGLTAFEVSVEGQPVHLGQRRGPVPVSEFDRFDPDVIVGAAPLYGLTPQGEWAVVADGAVRPLRSDEAGDGLDPASSIGVGPSGSTVAGATADRAAMMIGSLRAPAQLQQAPGGPVAAGPAIDVLGRVWWTTSDGRVLVSAVDDSGGYSASPVMVVDSPGPVRAVRPARDGTRAALLIDDGTVHLAVVAATADGLRIQGLRPLGIGPGCVDLAWHDADTVTALLPAAQRVERRDLAGSLIAAFAVPATASKVTDAPEDAVVVGLADGTAGPLSGSGVRVIEGLTMPAYPG